MSKKGLFILGICLFVIVIVALGILGNKFFLPEKIHYHAAFEVFENGVKKDFSANQYMNIKPCALDKENDEEEDMQVEKAHLHDNVGDIVHVERMGAVWGDLFENLHYVINGNNTIAYINGKKIDNFQNQPINAYDTLMVFAGSNPSIQSLLLETPSKTYIETQEKKSIDCSD